MHMFLLEGHPDEIVMDNGPPFNSKEFAINLCNQDITHLTFSLKGKMGLLDIY